MLGTGNDSKRQRMSAGERRDFILARAKQVFARNSYHEASTSELARESGVTEPMLYKHFGSKKNLFLEVLRQFGTRFTQNWQHRLDESSQRDALQALAEVGLEYRSAVKADSDILKVYFQAIAESGDPEIADVARRNVRNVHDFIRSLVERAKEQGQIDPKIDVEVATWGYMSMAFAMQISLMLKMDNELDEQKLQEINQVWLRGLTGC